MIHDRLAAFVSGRTWVLWLLRMVSSVVDGGDELMGRWMLRRVETAVVHADGVDVEVPGGRQPYIRYGCADKDGVPDAREQAHEQGRKTTRA